jgi:hypothetical protein
MSTPILVALIVAVSSLISVWLGSYLQLRSTEHQIRSTALHDHRTEILGHIYALVYETHLALQRWVTPSGYDSEEQLRAVERLYNELVDYYYPRALWLEKDTRKTLEALIKNMKSVYLDFGVLPGSGTSPTYQGFNAPPDDKIGELRHQVIMRVLDQIPTLIRQLDDEFQTILYPPRRLWYDPPLRALEWMQDRRGKGA